ncbi:MAG: ROK family protein [Candidatus Saccharibacteria bacterium]|nr:ROK family protein [Candidatus Saccharibacteria bacterium]
MYLAIDIGGTKTLLAVFSADGKVVESLKFPTPPAYQDFLTELEVTFNKLKKRTYKGAAMAIPGRINRQTGVAEAFGNLAWKDVPLKHDIEGIIGCKLIIENDAKVAGLSEARLLPDFKRVLYITISTGIGGALITKGKIDQGLKDAEIGQIIMEHDGELMRWEEFASGKAIVAKFGKRASDIAADDNSTWYIVARNIAIGLIDVIAMLTPDAIVIGGGVGSHLPKFQNRLEAELRVYENDLLHVPPIFQAKHPEEAVVYGCYELVKDANYETVS